MQTQIGKHKFELKTPCLLLDIDSVRRNIRKMARYFASRRCKLRPHAKTHKTLYIARQQIKAGAIGITVAKLEDAKALAEGGIDNILIANEIVGSDKLDELAELARETQITVCVDCIKNAQNLSDAAFKKDAKIGILIEVDVGLNRCGVEPGKSTLELLKKIFRLRGLKFKGLLGYEGAMFYLDGEEKIKECQRRNELLVETKDIIKSDGFEVEIVSAGGTNTYKITGNCEGITEIQPGSYVTMDQWNLDHGIDFEPAVTILTTVISRPTKGRAIVDAGLKAISADHGLPRFINISGSLVTELNEEHGRVLVDQTSKLTVGDKLEFIPTHGCTSIPLYDRYIAIKNGTAVEEFKIVSRSAAY